MEIIVPRSIVDISQVKLRFSTGLVAQWITRLTTDQKIAGSNPAELAILASCKINLLACPSLSSWLQIPIFTICPGGTIG